MLQAPFYFRFLHWFGLAPIKELIKGRGPGQWGLVSEAFYPVLLQATCLS